MSAEQDSPPTVTTKHAQLTLSQIAEQLPGAGPVMVEVSRTFAALWFAAEGGNWPLAAFYWRRTRSRLRALAITRPKYATQLEAFVADHLAPIMAAIDATDMAALKAAYQSAVDRANALHAETGYDYIRWRRPAQAPDPGLDYGPSPGP